MTSKSQKILVLGGTGGTGRLVVTEALARGHAVSVLARSAEKAKPLKPTDIVLGDATDEAVLRRAVRGQDAVISVLGTPASPFRRVTTLSTATRVLIRAMEAEGTSRLVAVTGIGAGDSRGHGGALFDLVLRPLILRNVYADKDRQEALIRGSSLDLDHRPTRHSERPPRHRPGPRPDRPERHSRRRHPPRRRRPLPYRRDRRRHLPRAGAFDNGRIERDTFAARRSSNVRGGEPHSPPRG